MKTKNTLYDIVVSLGFVVLLLVFLVLFVVLPKADTDPNENRALAQLPVPDIQHLDDFPKPFDSYVNDHFPYRPYWIRTFNRMHIQVFKQAVDNKIVVGKKGWFYMSGGELAAYQARQTYSPEELQSIHAELRRRKAFVEQNGGKFYLAIAPSKYSVHPEFLFANFRQVSISNKRQQVIAYLKEKGDIACLDLTDALLANKKDIRLYHKTDNHWNQLGAFYAAQALLKLIHKDFPELAIPKEEDYDIDIRTEGGKNIIHMVGLEHLYPEHSVYFVPKDTAYRSSERKGYPVPEGFPYPDEFEMDFVNPTAPKINLLMIRESFGLFAMPYLNASFGESVYIFDGWQHGLNENIVEAEQADVVVVQIQEPFLDNLLQKKTGE